MNGRRAGNALNVTFGMLVTLTVMTSLAPYSVDSSLPGFPSAAEELDVAPSTMQLSISALLIGVAIGQLLFGTLSDRFGRRAPLIAGVALSTVAAVVAALAPSVWVLIGARLCQGLAGSATVALGKAIIRDRTSGEDTTAILTMTTVASGILNLFASLIGGQFVAAFGWRGPLWFIAGYSAMVLVMVVLAMPETHAPEHRDVTSRWLGLPSIVRHLGNRRFMLWVLVQAGSYGALMAYVASSSFVYQNQLGYDSATYGLLFSLNAAAAVTCNFVANRFLRHLGSTRLVALGLGLSMIGTALVASSAALSAPAAVTAACITLSMAPLGLNGPNLVGLALNEVSRWTGSAAATIGFVQFFVGAVVSPVVGMWGTDTIVPQVVSMFGLAAAAMTLLAVSVWRWGSPAADGQGR